MFLSWQLQDLVAWGALFQSSLQCWSGKHQHQFPSPDPPIPAGAEFTVQSHCSATNISHCSKPGVEDVKLCKLSQPLRCVSQPAFPEGNISSPLPHVWLQQHKWEYSSLNLCHFRFLFRDSMTQISLLWSGRLGGLFYFSYFLTKQSIVGFRFLKCQG